MSDQHRPDFNDTDMGFDEPEVNRGVSSVATAPAKNIAILGVGVVILLVVLYNILFGTDEKEEPSKDGEEQTQTAGIDELPGAKAPAPETMAEAKAPPEPEPVSTSYSLPTEIVLPDPPKILAPAPPPPPPTPAGVPSLVPPPPGGVAPDGANNPGVAKLLVGENVDSDGGNSGTDATKKTDPEADLKNASSLILGGGGEGGGIGSFLGKGDAGSQAAIISGIPESTAEKATATRIKDLQLTIAQGKLIEAVLETPINTDLPGLLRAVVSNNIYSEQGRNVLVPRGSRLIGNYESTVERGQRRVYIIWGRVIRPDGIDIAIDSPGTDQLGRAGIEGKVDNKYFEIFGSSLLVSAITTTAALVGEQLSDSEGISETRNTDGSTNTSGSVSDFAISDAVTNVGDVGTELVEDLLKLQPTITVDQGARIKVFVNKDLIFPATVNNGVMFIQ